ATQRLLDLQPRVATCLVDGEEKIVPIRAVGTDDTVMVKPGERIPVDGVVTNGHSSVDEAMLTGESQAVNKKEGDIVSAGTINAHGVLQVKVTGSLKNTALGRIIRLVEEAQGSKAPIQCLADQIVPWFVAVTLLLATTTFLFWVDNSFEVALLAATSVLIITCPCAFGLATPMSIAVASGLGAKYGILVKNGEVLETLSSINHVVFDKTGTLTEGGMSVVGIYTEEAEWEVNQTTPPAESVVELMQKAFAIERFSEHPTAQAVTSWYQAFASGTIRLKGSEFKYRPGLGVSGIVADQQLCAGNSVMMGNEGLARSDRLEQLARQLGEQGVGSFYIGIDGRQVGLVAVEDRIRPDARELIS
ncbi:MAG: HAD-IC family P-type ATPase, partial [Candidatus Thiodiazotropha endolucinida]|nr:HAD-IC family P-type ATPase [Candidatus Thiodiazotropha taylori]MCW4347051.1 HAD-IC family P-type ATPase [Candidatus Thiodiazotropha endolucinida]